jgi:hypothetical protein
LPTLPIKNFCSTTSPATSYRREKPQPPSSFDLERPLPNNLDAERSILGAILLDDHALSTAIENVRPEDFFLDQHRRIYARMIALGESQQAIDLVTLTEDLHRLGELEASGGNAYLSALADGMPRVSNVEHYARIVNEKALLRAGVHLAYKLQQDFFAGASPAAEISARGVERLSTKISASSSRSLKTYTPAEVAALTTQKLETIAAHIAIRGMIVTLDGPAKSAGKSTFVTTAIGAMTRAELFLNTATVHVPCLYVTEENPASVRLLVNRASLHCAHDLHFFFAGMSMLPWPELAARIARACADLKIGWLVLDTFHGCARLGGDAENTAGVVDEALAPIRDLAGRLGVAVTVTRHTRKAGGTIGESGRGSGAFTGAMDSILELKRLNSLHAPANRRRLEIAGRIAQETLEIELSGGSYRIVEEPADDVHQEDAALLASAIASNPQISRRALEKVTGIGRNRIGRLLSAAGWSFGTNGWVVLS